MKNKKPKHKTSPAEIKEIERLTSKGVSDRDIQKQTGLNLNVVTRYSTLYWQRKMNNKTETPNQDDENGHEYQI